MMMVVIFFIVIVNYFSRRHAQSLVNGTKAGFRAHWVVAMMLARTDPLDEPEQRSSIVVGKLGAPENRPRGKTPEDGNYYSHS